MSLTGVSAVGDTTGTATTTSSKSASDAVSNALDMDAFLTLFLTQLQYQDPTNPMESYEMAAQLAQFSTVSELSKMNSNVTSLLNSVSSLANAQMINLIGKEVVAQSNTLQVTDGTSSSGQYEFELASGSTATVTISISDEAGNVVRTKTLESQAGGEYEVAWDGLDNSGKKVSDGSYTFKVTATDSSGNRLDVSTKVSGTAYSYVMDGGGQYLILDGPNGAKVSIGNITQVSATTSS